MIDYEVIMRMNMFDKLSLQYHVDYEIEKISVLFASEFSIYTNNNYLSIESFVDRFVFHRLEWRGSCLNCGEMKKMLGIDDFLLRVDQKDFPLTQGEILIYLEYVVNIMESCKMADASDVEIRFFSRMHCMLVDNIALILDQLNYQQVLDENSSGIILCEKNNEASAVAEYVSDSLAFSVFEYNHHAIQGKIDEKKKILLALAGEVEPMSQQLKNEGGQAAGLIDDANFLLNNLNIRHNNVDQTGKHYKEHVAALSGKELEDWYDETYRTLILCILANNHIERSGKIKEIKKEVGKKSD